MIQFTIKYAIDSLIVRYTVAHNTRSSIKTKIAVNDASAEVTDGICRVVVVS